MLWVSSGGRSDGDCGGGGCAVGAADVSHMGLGGGCNSG